MRPLTPASDWIARCMAPKVILLRDLESRYTSLARMRTISGIMPGVEPTASAGLTPRASFCEPTAP